MKDNRREQAIPPGDLVQARTKIDEAKTLLAPYLIALTPEERQKMPKMGEKSLEFVEKAHDFALQNPNLVPPYLDMDEFGKDFSEAHGLWTVHNAVRQLDEGLADTEMAVGSAPKSLWLFGLGVLQSKTPRNYGIEFHRR
ncbi:MAG: hypothetical protein LBD37_01965 [Treponema sp.]|jgi:hypothetical protein|nr:hypothetical protein [Treponema sp.]